MTILEFDELFDSDRSDDFYYITNNGMIYPDDKTDDIEHVEYGYILSRNDSRFKDEDSPYHEWLSMPIKKIITDNPFYNLIIFL